MDEPRDLTAGLVSALKAIRQKLATPGEPESKLQAVDQIAARALTIASVGATDLPPERHAAAAIKPRFLIDLGNVQVDADGVVWVNQETVLCQGVDVFWRQRATPRVNVLGIYVRENGEPE